jgi:iron complex outermembrane receptor protein
VARLIDFSHLNAKSGGRRFRSACFFFFLASLSASGTAWPQQKSDDLTSISLEDLMNVQVTSVSKKEQKLSRTASAIFVISEEDIRRSGALNIPDLLRMVPGMNVAQISANTWAVSARGFNEEFSDKLLVLIDGRSVYTPTFAGVFWDTADLPLQDIERIEVIRGPGGTVWGANAVNGVINIITKRASETHGASLEGGGGNFERGFGTVQYGGKMGSSTDGRAYLQYGNHEGLPALNEMPGGDGWHTLRGGFRTDSTLSSKDTLTVQGDLYGGREGQGILNLASGAATDLEGYLGGGYLQTVWNHRYSARSDSSLQVSFDRYTRDVPFTDKRNTIDTAFQYHFAWGNRQDVVAGVEYEYTNHKSNSALVFYSPSDDARQFFSAFVQDEIALVPDRLYFTIGTKIEHNDYTGFADMPDVRLAWELSRRHMLWTAVSRAERIPSSGDTSDVVNGGEIAGPGGVPIQLILQGSPNFKNETLLAYEVGYRSSLSDRLSADLSAFFNSYHDLRTIQSAPLTFQPDASPPGFLENLFFQNGMYGETHGGEASLNWKAISRWTLSPGYAFESFHMHLSPDSDDTTLFPAAQGGSPQHSAQLRSHLELAHGLNWDASAYFVDRLPAFHVPSYTRLDTGLTWRWTERASFSVVGQNLVADHHVESVDSTSLVTSSLIKRSAYAKFTWQF